MPEKRSRFIFIIIANEFVKSDLSIYLFWQNSGWTYGEFAWRNKSVHEDINSV